MTIPTAVARAKAQVGARLFRGLAEPTLTMLIPLLAKERTLPELVPAVGANQPGACGHPARLCDCGRVANRPGRGRSVRYRLASPSLHTLLRAAEDLLADGGHPVTLRAEQPGRPQ